MSRPALPRRVRAGVTGRGFRPVGAGPAVLEQVVIDVAHLEAIRLVDREGLYQEAAAERMGVSRPTFARILAHAWMAIAEALLDEKMLLVRRADLVEAAAALPAVSDTCPVHGGPRRRGRSCHCPHASEGPRPRIIPLTIVGGGD